MAPTLKQVSSIVEDNLSPICADAPQGLIRRSKSEYRWLVGNSSLRLGSLERAHVDNNRGGNAELIIFEEGGFVDSDSYRYAVQDVLGPQLLRSGGVELHISSPSEDAEHYLHTHIMPTAEEQNLLFRYTVYDSPSITKEQIEKAIERCGGRQTEAFKREYLAEVIRSESLMVIPEFDTDLHVKEVEIPSHYNGILSIDMGGIRDKTAGYICIWDFERSRMIVTHEMFLDANSPTSKVVEDARGILSLVNIGSNVFADVPGQVQVDMIESHNFQIAPPHKDDRDAAINNLRLLFQKQEIEIHPRCVNLIGCLKSARYNDKRTDFLRTDRYGHADPIMALVYGARMLYPMRSINPFPKPKVHRDYQLKLDYRSTEFDHLKQLAGELLPWNGTKRR